MTEIAQIFARFRSKVDFLAIYIDEAHPIGGWEAPDQPYKIHDAATLEERALTGDKFFKLVEMPGDLAVDLIASPIRCQFDCWPARLCVLVEGQVVYMQKQGPLGYKPQCLTKFLEETVSLD